MTKGPVPASSSLLVNADDFGLHADINRGILDCVERGRVQSISFSPIGESADWAKLLELVRHGVRVGLHVTLVGERWATDGRIVSGWRGLAKQLLVSGPVMQKAVESEIRRQFDLCADHGFDPSLLSHLDSHQHVHLLGGVWQTCVRIAGDYSIPRIRVPWCPSLRDIKKSFGGLALQALARQRRTGGAGFLACLGLAHAGHNTAETLSMELNHAARAGWPPAELIAHPGVNTPGLQSRYADWNFDWSRERDALLSNRFAEGVRASGYMFVR
ncbi:MAG TPA: ChbG/HpnK family deacetylase [Candidatus Acidoferrales bacterium]|nr:ChbG/HpnK family deacetylase [Candidatus Acidoferrales bacterium]